jgi:hypothetical protein
VYLKVTFTKPGSSKALPLIVDGVRPTDCVVKDQPAAISAAETITFTSPGIS